MGWSPSTRGSQRERGDEKKWKGYSCAVTQFNSTCVCKCRGQRSATSVHFIWSGVKAILKWFWTSWFTRKRVQFDNKNYAAQTDPWVTGSSAAVGHSDSERIKIFPFHFSSFKDNMSVFFQTPIQTGWCINMFYFEYLYLYLLASQTYKQEGVELERPPFISMEFSQYCSVTADQSLIQQKAGDWLYGAQCILGKKNKHKSQQQKNPKSRSELRLENDRLNWDANAFFGPADTGRDITLPSHHLEGWEFIHQLGPRTRREEKRISAEDQKSTDSVASVPSSSASLCFQTPLSLPLLRY